MDLQRILVIVLVLMVLGSGYYYYYYQSSAVTPATAESNPVIAELDARLNEIRPLASIELDTSLFDNAFFRSLKIITATTGPAVIPGRVNPFVPY